MPSMVAPRTGGDELTVAEDQLEYKPITVALHYDQSLNGLVMVSRWRFTPEERERIAKGDDLFIGVMTFGESMQPLLLSLDAGELPPPAVFKDVTDSNPPQDSPHA